mgnify:FL=1
MKKFSFVMPEVGNPMPQSTDVPGFTSGGTGFYSIGPGISEIMLPDGTIVNVDPQGNILKDIVD